jgi:hypothetical protein
MTKALCMEVVPTAKLDALLCFHFDEAYATFFACLGALEVLRAQQSSLINVCAGTAARQARQGFLGARLRHVVFTCVHNMTAMILK